MRRFLWMPWAAAALSAALLELPFPLAGPMPPWRGALAWIGLVPLLWAILSSAGTSPRPLRQGFLLGYLCGFLWYAGNCYWVRDTMSRYGDMPVLAPTLLLTAFSLVLGLYCGFFGLLLTLVRRGPGGLISALVAAPLLWVALDLAAARITSVPWDQLGYSQVDNLLVTRLAPYSGVYGITFLLVAANALLAAAILPGSSRGRALYALLGGGAIATGLAGLALHPAKSPTSATAVLVQPNLDVGSESNWSGPGEWDGHFSQFTHLAGEQCKTYIAGIPQTGAPAGEIVCPPYPTHPDLVVWPESPAPFFQADPRLQQSVRTLARSLEAPLVLGGIGMDYADGERRWREYNSAMVFAAEGSRIGRYDKVHLVPFGEFVPYEQLLFFAKKLTGRVSKFDRGSGHNVVRVADPQGQFHRYGIFICYEAVFAEEVRHFAANGAEVLVNISDDGWYGDTSAPWQHLNMARMRAIESRRWLLRDTNNGVTAAIDPLGRVRQSIPRRQADALPAAFGYRDEVTVYAAHGDVFAWCCAILAVVVVVRSMQSRAERPVQHKVRS